MHRSDDNLARDVAAMLADPLRGPEEHAIEASVAEGIVTLRGAVPAGLARAERDGAEDPPGSSMCATRQPAVSLTPGSCRADPAT